MSQHDNTIIFTPKTWYQIYYTLMDDFFRERNILAGTTTAFYQQMCLCVTLLYFWHWTQFAHSNNSDLMKNKKEAFNQIVEEGNSVCERDRERSRVKERETDSLFTSKSNSGYMIRFVFYLTSNTHTYTNTYIHTDENWNWCNFNR